MPNYRYNNPDYMRRNNCGCQPSMQNVQAVQTECQMPKRTTCCDDRTEYDALAGLPIAMAYVPWQEWYAVCDVKKGFQCGTIFEELNKPFKGIGGCC